MLLKELDAGIGYLTPWRSIAFRVFLKIINISFLGPFDLVFRIRMVKIVGVAVGLKFTIVFFEQLDDFGELFKYLSDSKNSNLYANGG